MGSGRSSVLPSATGFCAFEWNLRRELVLGLVRRREASATTGGTAALQETVLRRVVLPNRDRGDLPPHHRTCGSAYGGFGGLS